MGLAGSHRPRKGCSSWWPSRVRQEPASIAAIVSSGGTMVGLQMPRAIEILDANAWPLVNEILSGKRNAPPGSPAVTTTLRKRWEKVQSDGTRLDLLKLLARIELTKAQALRAITKYQPRDLLANPYYLFESERGSEEDPIAFHTIDRAILPGHSGATPSCRRQPHHADAARHRDRTRGQRDEKARRLYRLDARDRCTGAVQSRVQTAANRGGRPRQII